MEAYPGSVVRERKEERKKEGNKESRCLGSGRIWGLGGGSAVFFLHLYLYLRLLDFPSLPFALLCIVVYHT